MDRAAVESRHRAAVEVGRKLQSRSLEPNDHHVLFAACSDIPELLDHIEELREKVVDLVQVGWIGPYGIIPGGMDNDPAPNWEPIFMKKAV